MGADIKVYDITDLDCQVLYKGIHYSVWKDPYTWEINVFEPGGKYVGWSLARVASFDDTNLRESFASQSFIDTFVSNMLFEDFKYLGCQRIFARRGDEFCIGEVYQKLINKQGVYYENGKYIYVKTDSEGHVSKSLIFNSENDMYSVIKSLNKIDLSKPLSHISGKDSCEKINDKPKDERINCDEDDLRRDAFVNKLDEVSHKMEEAGQILSSTGKKVVTSGKKVVKTSIKTSKKVAAKSLLAGALVLSTAAAGTIYLHEKLHKKK